MAKADVVTAQLAAIQSGINGVLSDAVGAAYDQGMADAGAPATAGLTQADVDAAVAAAKAADAQALKDAVAAVQVQLDAMTAKEVSEESAVAALQAKLDQIKALLG